MQVLVLHVHQILLLTWSRRWYKDISPNIGMDNGTSPTLA